MIAHEPWMGHLNKIVGLAGRREFKQTEFQKFICPGVARGGDFMVRFDRYIISNDRESCLFSANLKPFKK